MKTCPSCKSEIEDNYDLCWKCNYSFTENKVVDIKRGRKTLVKGQNLKIEGFLTFD